MKTKVTKKESPRIHVLAVKVTAEEKKKIDEFATKECVNISALIRQLLFDRLEKNGA